MPADVYKFLDTEGLEHVWGKVLGRLTHYATCNTAGSTVNKVVTTDSDFVLRVGAVISVKFTNRNTANNPRINVNDTGAKPIWYNVAVVATSNLTAAGDANLVTTYMYDGTNWVWLSQGRGNDPDFQYNQYSSQYTVSGNGSVTGTIDPSLQNYNFLSIGGFNSGDTNVVVIRLDYWQSDGLIHYVLRNLSSSSVTSTLTVRVLQYG